MSVGIRQNDAEPFIGTDEFSIEEPAILEGNTTGKGVLNIYLLSATAGVGLGAFLFGYHMGLPSPAFPYVAEQLNLNDSERSTLVSIVMLGAAAGSLFTGSIADKLGRRLALVLAGLPLAIGPLLFAIGNVFWLLAVARFITGIGVGSASVLVPMYIAEIAPPSVRGMLGSSNQLLITVGILAAYLIGFTLLANGMWWRWMSVIAAATALLLVIVVAILPDTPRWLVMNRMKPQARDALALFLNASPRSAPVATALADVENTVAIARSSGEASWVDLLDRTMLKLLFVGSMLMVFQQFSGANAMINFSVDIFKRAGYGESASTTASVLVGSVQVVVTLISCVISDKAGRRVLLFIATLVMASSHALIGVFFYVGTWPGTIAVAGLMGFIAAFSIGMGPVPWVIVSEIFPLKVRGKAISVCTLVNWTCNYIIAQTFLPLQSVMAIHAVFWLYGAICLVAFCFVVLKVPETKGKTLDQIQDLF